MINFKWRKPDEVIGENYMSRWHLRRKAGHHNLYLHRYDGSDDDRALHDHPWRSIGVVIWGDISEVTLSGEKRLWPLVPKFRSARYSHRLHLNSRTAFTLFFTFPKEREWGFLCPNGWVHWKEFTDSSGQKKGAGCPD
jgi:hypothetical protein